MHIFGNTVVLYNISYICGIYESYITNIAVKSEHPKIDKKKQARKPPNITLILHNKVFDFWPVSKASLHRYVSLVP